MSIENEPPVGQHEWAKGYFGVSGQCSRCGARASLAANSPCIWRPIGDECRPGLIGSAAYFAQAGSPEAGRYGHVSGGDRPKSSRRQRIGRAGMHLRAALRHLGYFLSDLVGWQREPIAVELAPDADGDLHPATLCKCEVGADAPPERHTEGCLWAAVMCRHCAGPGQCPTCSGDGISPDPDNADRGQFSRALLALFDAAHERTLPEPDGTVFCGAAKDLLLALGMTWDEKAQKYRLNAEGPEDSHG